MGERIIEMKDDQRDEQHWKFPSYKQRMTRKQWKILLLRGGDKIIFRGKITPLKAVNLGCGVYEVGKE